LRILVIEDNRDILAQRAGLPARGKGYTVDCAARRACPGRNLAVKRAITDLIVAGFMLPGLSTGYQLCSGLRDDAQRDTTIIMLTARDQLDDRLKGLKSGADDYCQALCPVPEHG